MKWVHLGVGQALLFVIIAAYIDKNHRMAILAGGGTSAALMYIQYFHAKAAGLKNGGPGTEPAPAVTPHAGPGRPGAVRWGY